MRLPRAGPLEPFDARVRMTLGRLISMIRRALAVGLCAATVADALAGCAQMQSCYPNMYAALQAREQLVHPTPPGQRITEPLSYQHYQAQRRALDDGGARRGH